ncbi:hypothetical protein ACF1CG_18700 [Streptomyces sp. NPDC014773]|uniref:hypothetical protein n=1 Tax=Streptomyces sp. NPDC014773 TaxID=3364908 RepID=UPI0036F807AB
MNESDRHLIPSAVNEALSSWLSAQPDTSIPNLELSDLPIVGSGAFLREAFALALEVQRGVAGPVFFTVSDDRIIVVECKAYRRNLGRVRNRLWTAASKLQAASTARERRAAAREFREALVELVAHVFVFLVRVLLRFLSGLLGRTTAADVAATAPVPLERTPNVTPRGPNAALPVNTHRGGHHSSAQGSAVLAA